MALNQLGKSQLKDKSVHTQHLADGAVQASHLSAASINNNHLSVDWALLAPTILGTKLVIDYVQPDSVAVTSGTVALNVTDLISGLPAADATSRGVIVTPPHNKVIVRQFENTEKPINDIDGEEVKGRLVHDGSDYSIEFYTVVGGVETPYAFIEDDVLVFQYPQRFDLSTVPDTFGVNEKFVDNAIDVTSHFNITQLAADVFGDSYTLNKDGVPTVTVSLAKRIDDLDTALLALTEEHEDADVATNARINILKTELDDIKDQLKTISETPKAEMKRIDKWLSADDVAGDVTSIAIDAGVLPVGVADIYVNGVLQMSGPHYVEAEVDGFATSIEFAPEKLLENDVVQVRWVV